jgi:hypothetical protein
MNSHSESLDYKKFLLFGDSISQHCYNPYPDHNTAPEFALGGALQHAYSRKLDVVCRGFHGYTSEYAKHFLEKILEDLNHSENSKVVIGTIFFGTNDCSTSGPQVVQLEQFLENLKSMIASYREYGVKPILCGIAKLDEKIWHPSELDRTLDVMRKDDSHLKYSLASKNLLKKKISHLLIIICFLRNLVKLTIYLT